MHYNYTTLFFQYYNMRIKHAKYYFHKFVLNICDGPDWRYNSLWINGPYVNGAVSSASVVSSNLSGREAEQSNDYTSLLRNQYH